VRFSSS